MGCVNMTCCSSLGKTDCATYISSFSSHALLHLDLLLDWDSEGVDEDLNEIAHYMICWEDLSSSLKLTNVDIHDIKLHNPNKPELQRCVPTVCRLACIFLSDADYCWL